MNTINTYINQVVTGDCVTVLKNIESESVNFVLTDPPYLVNYQSRDGRKVYNDDNAAWLKPAFAEVARVLKPDSFCVSFYGWNKAEKFLTAWKSVGLYPVGHFVWVKRYASRSRFVLYSHESAYLLAKGHPARPRIILPDVLQWKYSGNRFHPTQKPVRALTPIIKAYTKPGDIVLDPFAGSGTTAVAAKYLGRKFIGIELNSDYAAIAARRLRALDAIL